MSVILQAASQSEAFDKQRSGETSGVIVTGDQATVTAISNMGTEDETLTERFSSLKIEPDTALNRGKNSIENEEEAEEESPKKALECSDEEPETKDDGEKQGPAKMATPKSTEDDLKSGDSVKPATCESESAEVEDLTHVVESGEKVKMTTKSDVTALEEDLKQMSLVSRSEGEKDKTSDGENEPKCVRRKAQENEEEEEVEEEEEQAEEEETMTTKLPAFIKKGPLQQNKPRNQPTQQCTDDSFLDFIEGDCVATVKPCTPMRTGQKRSNNDASDCPATGFTRLNADPRENEWPEAADSPLVEQENVDIFAIAGMLDEYNTCTSTALVDFTDLLDITSTCTAPGFFTQPYNVASPPSISVGAASPSSQAYTVASPPNISVGAASPSSQAYTVASPPNLNFLALSPSQNRSHLPPSPKRFEDPPPSNESFHSFGSPSSGYMSSTSPLQPVSSPESCNDSSQASNDHLQAFTDHCQAFTDNLQGLDDTSAIFDDVEDVIRQEKIQNIVKTFEQAAKEFEKKDTSTAGYYPQGQAQTVPVMTAPQTVPQSFPTPPQPYQTPPQETPPQTPPYQTPPYQTPPYQTPPYQAPPSQTPPYLAPPSQTPPYQAPPSQTPPYQTLPYQAPPSQTPPNRTPPRQPPAQTYQPHLTSSQSSVARNQSGPLMPAGGLKNTGPIQVPPLHPYPVPANIPSCLQNAKVVTASQSLPIPVTEMSKPDREVPQRSRPRPILPAPPVQSVLISQLTLPQAPPKQTPPTQAPPTQAPPTLPNFQPAVRATPQVNTNRNSDYKKLARANLAIAKMSLPELLRIDEDGDTQLHLHIVKEPEYAMALIYRLMRDQQLSQIIDHKNYLNQTPLYLAVKVESVELVAELLKHNTDVNVEATIPKSKYKERDCCTPLHSVAQRGENALAILDLLLSVPTIELDPINYKGETPLLQAIRAHGHKRADEEIDSRQTIRKLLQHGASLKKGDRCSGRTPLHHLVESKKYELLRFVLEEAQKIQEQQYKQQITQLHGKMYNQVFMADVVNCQTFDGTTALHLAAGLNVPQVEDHVKLVRLLLSHGADATKKNSNNATPKEIVFKKRQPVIDALRGHSRK